METRDNRKWTVLVFLYVLASFIVTLFYLPVNALHPDEAHYWVWSLRPQAGYFDNSPLISLVIRASTSIFGNTEFGVRFPAALAYLLLSAIVFLAARRIRRSTPAALLSVVLFSSMPIALVGSHLITHDVPLIIFASLTWFFLYQALLEGKKLSWYWAGLTFGLALLAKYQAVLIGLSALLLLLARKDFRANLRRKEPYLAALISLLLFTPTLIWNARNGWVSFVFQTNHGVQTAAGLHLTEFLSYLLGQMFVVSPLFFLALCYFAGKKLLHPRAITPVEAFLLAGCLPTLAFFGFTSLTKAAAPNWPLAAYFTASIFVASQLINRSRRTVLILTVLSVLISWCPVVLVRYPAVSERLGLWIPAEAVLPYTLEGWRELGRHVTQAVDREALPPGSPVFAETYQMCSELLFYTRRPVSVLTTPRQRLNQFDLWTLPALASFDGAERIAGDCGDGNGGGIGPVLPEHPADRRTRSAGQGENPAVVPPLPGGRDTGRRDWAGHHPQKSGLHKRFVSGRRGSRPIALSAPAYTGHID